MNACGKLAAPGAPGSAEMSFQTRTQTAEGLQLPMRWVTQTLRQLEKERSGARESVEGRTEEKGRRRLWGEWSRMPWATVRQCLYPLLYFGGQGWLPPWTSGCDQWFTNPNYTLPEEGTILGDSPRVANVLSWPAMVTKLAVCKRPREPVLNLRVRICMCVKFLKQQIKMHTHLNVFILPCFCSFACPIFF